MANMPWEDPKYADDKPSTPMPWEDKKYIDPNEDAKYDTTPFPVGKYKDIRPFKDGNVAVPWKDDEVAIANTGVDIKTGAPEYLKQVLSLSMDNTDRRTVIENYFHKKGVNTEVRMGPTSGELEFLNPATNRFTLVYPKNARNITAGSAIEMTGEVLGGVGGFLAGNAVNPLTGSVLSVPGTAVGRTLAEEVKSNLGKAFGANLDRKQPEIARDALEGGAISGMFAGLGEIAFGLPRAARSWAFGIKPLTRSQATQLLNGVREVEPTLREFEELTGRKLDMPLHQRALASTDQKVQTLGAKISSKYKSALADDPELATEENLRQERNQSSLESAYESIADKYRPKNVENIQLDPHVGEREARNLLIEQREREEAALRAQELSAREEAQARVRGLPALSPQQIDARMRGIVSEKYEATKKVTDKTWGDHYVNMGVDPKIAYNMDRMARYDIPYTPTTQIELSGKFKARLQTYIDKAYRENLDSSAAGSDVAVLPDNLIEWVNGKPRVKLGLTTVDSLQIINHLKDLRSGVRRSMAANKGLNFNKAREVEVDTMLEEEMFDAWGRQNRPDLIQSYEKAKQASKDQKEAFEEGYLRRLLEKDHGRTPLAENVTMADVFYKGDAAATRQLRQILDGDPGTLDEARDMIFSLYRNNERYVKGDIPTKAGTARFLTEYSSAIENFFTKADIEQLKATGNMYEVIARHKEKYTNFMKVWDKSFAPQIGGSPNSVLISDWILKDKTDPGMVLQLKDWLMRTNPELLEKVQYGVARRIRDKTSTNNVPNFTKIDKQIGANAQRIEAIMPENYLEHLRIMTNTARFFYITQKRDAAAAATKPIPLLKQVIRAIFIPPLSRAGTVQTLGAMSRADSAARIWNNAISDPVALRKYIRFLNADARTLAGVGVLSSLGGTSFIYDGNTNESLPRTGEVR